MARHGSGQVDRGDEAHDIARMEELGSKVDVRVDEVAGGWAREVEGLQARDAGGGVRVGDEVGAGANGRSAAA